MLLLKARSQVYDLSNGFERSTDLADNDFKIGDKGEWWTSSIDRKTMKALMRRENARPLADYGLWLALLVASGYVAFLSWGTWWAIPAFLVYGTIYSSCDPRSHDLGHGATFRSRWLNDAFLYLTLFMTMKEPVLWRWRHTRHHTDTIHVGRDPEILVTRPADLLRVAADFFFVFQAIGELKPALMHAFGRITSDASYYVPKSEQPKMIWSSRLLIGSMTGLTVYYVVTGNWMPLLFVWGPRFYGNWLNFLGFLTQHAALAEDAYDHRLNTRTFLMNPALEFLYAKMNYHIEHHIYPMVPYYNLPEMHKLMKERNELPYTYVGLVDVYREILPALFRQAREPGYFVQRELPAA